jgi:hypothetical protein
MSGKLLIGVIVALALYIAATKTKVSVQPQVKMPETRWLPKIIKLPEIELVPKVDVTIAEDQEPAQEPFEEQLELVADVAVESPAEEVYTHPQPVTRYIQPAQQPVRYYYYYPQQNTQYSSNCGPNGCGPVRGFRPLGRLFGRR